MNIYTRRTFLERCALGGVGLGMASISNIPLVFQRALAEGTIGTNGKKLIFIWMRGANDALNTVIPALDPSYSAQRSGIYIPRINQSGGSGHTNHTFTSEYSMAGFFNAMPGAFAGNKMFDATRFKSTDSTARTSADNTYIFGNSIPTGNGFAAIHPGAKWLAPIYNEGDLAIIHRVAYPGQSRSHFDSQRLWENGKPGDIVFKEGIFYRTMLEAINASPVVAARSLTGVSFQGSLPLILQGSKVAMTNLSDPTRYSLLGIPDAAATGRKLATNYINSAQGRIFPHMGSNRDVLDLQYESFNGTLKTFAEINFSDSGNLYFDDIATDMDEDWANAVDDNAGDNYPTKPAGEGYRLFPYNNNTNGGYRRPVGGVLTDPSGNNNANEDANRYVIPTNQYGFMRNLKAAALVALQTDAIITGCELGGFDTHNNQGGATGAHANLARAWSWGLYALMKFFKRYGKGGDDELPNAQVGWDDVVVVTLSEFGRTSAQNSNGGTDHAEATCMFVAGGAVNGGVYCCGPSTEMYNGKNITWNVGNGNVGTSGQNGDMYGASSRYLKRAVDYRSVLGKIIRDHLGSTQNQLNRIIPGYATDSKLLTGGNYTGEGGNPTVAGELPIV